MNYDRQKMFEVIVGVWRNHVRVCVWEDGIGG